MPLPREKGASEGPLRWHTGLEVGSIFWLRQGVSLTVEGAGLGCALTWASLVLCPLL